jgi:hypothetical protein
MRTYRWIIAVVTAVAATLPLASPTSANLSTYRFKYSTVCVVDHTGSRWPIDTAVSRWTAVPDLSFRYGVTCGQQVHVYEGWYGSNWHGGRYYGWTTPWLYSHKTYGSYEKLSDGTWREYRCTIAMNNTYGVGLSWADRRSAVMHELGHCTGLAHTSRTDSLMNIYHWRDYNYPTGYDKSETERRYPW